MTRNSYKMALALLLFLLFPSIGQAQRLSADFRQGANNDAPMQRGDVHWVQSILQGNNSLYFEGMSVPQRILLQNIPSSRGNTHSLTFRHLATKGGKHAYDFLTSYDQAVAAAAAIAGPGILVNLNECGGTFGPPATSQKLCGTLHGGPHSALVDLPDDMGNTLSHDVSAAVRGYENEFHNRTLKIHGDAPISSAVMTFNGYSGNRDVYAEYTLSWTSASSSLLIEMAGHLALGADVAGAGSGIGYGSGLGAGSISGAPFHFKLDRLDGKALGSRDNQIQGNSIQIPLSCNVSGPSTVCAGTNSTFAFASGTQGASYSWSFLTNSSGASIVGATNGASVIVDAGSQAGSYELLVTVSNGAQTIACTTAVTVNGISISTSATPILCYGGTSDVTVTATGGAAPYKGAGTFTVRAGTHSYTVTDANGCSSTVAVNVTEPTALTASVATVGTGCANNSPTVTVNVTASGGTPPYQGTGTFTVPANTTSFQVTDANGCTANTTMMRAPSTQLSAGAVASGAIDCHGGTTTVTVSATGGAAPYTGTGTFTVGAGTHNYTVTDNNGCTASTSITVTQPASALAVSATATPLTCGVTTSTVTVTASGGTAPYTGTGTFSAPAGTHTYTVTDANGCSASTTVTIQGATSALTVSATANGQVDCYGGTTTVDVTATGGTPPYQGTGTFTVAAGTHSFTVTDNNSCTGTANVTITQPASALSAAATANGQITCYGGTTTVDVTATGGTAPYSGTGTFTVGAGTHNYTVTDANGCTATTSITLTQPASSITVTATANGQINCHGGTTTVTVSATGGTAPYTGTGTFTVGAGTHNYTVTDDNGCTGTASITLTEPASTISVSATANGQISCYGGTTTVTVSATGGTAPYTGTGTFTVSAGTHNYTVTDNNGCTGTATITITQPSSAITVSATANGPIDCFGGTTTVTVSASGGTAPYTGTGTFTVSAGTHNYTVTDNNGCTGTASITVSQPASAISATAAANGQIDCFGGTTTVTVSATGGTAPYTGTGTFTVSAGTHNYTVTDANGCTATASVTVNQPSSALAAIAGANGPVTCNGGTTTVTVSATGGTSPYTGTGTFTVSAGTHTYTVTDDNGCTAQATVTVSQPANALDASASLSAAISCYGDSATVTVSATGGTAPYTGTGTFRVPAGTHTFTVTDDNSCTDHVTISVTQPASALAVSVTANGQIDCYGGTTTVTVSATGGTAPYTGTGTFTVSAGTHNYTVTDANGCTATASVTVNQPSSAVSIAISANGPILCHGGTTTVTVSGSGGTSPYTGTGTFTVSAGTHSYTVTDANGCSATDSITVTEPSNAIIVSASANGQVACYGDSTTVTVTATGGTAPYTGTGTFTVTAGTHVFTVTDANGCTGSDTITVTQPSLPLTAAASATSPVVCYGDSTTITVTASGGTPPYSGTGTYVRAAGVWTFTVTDANNCTATAVASITQPSAALDADASATQILCNGGSSTITVTATGGTAPYTGTGSFTRTAGTWSFVVTDDNGCTDTATVTVTEPALPLDVAASATPIDCNGGTSTVTVTATGGTPPYTGTGTFTETAGSYTYTVTDANGCTASAAVGISQPGPISVSAIPTLILCNGGTSTVTVGATGGTPPYTGTGTFTETAGTYTYHVNDANNCGDSVTITITEPPALQADASFTPILCNGGSTTVTVTASGGTGPYSGTGVFSKTAGTYTYVVTDANSCVDTVTINITEPPTLHAAAAADTIACYGDIATVTVTASGGTPPYTGTGVFSAAAGTHSYVVTDANGCASSVTITIAEPPQLAVAWNAPSIACNGESTTVTISATGGTPPYAGTGNFVRTAGSYSFTVTDANNCSETIQVTLTEPGPMNASVTFNPILCYGGTTSVTIGGAGGTPPYTGTGTYTLGEGNYSYIVTDANGCADTVDFTLTEPPLLTAAAGATPILCNGGTSTVTVTASGGTPSYGGTGTFTRTAGTYTFGVTDANGCAANISITITEPPALTAGATVTPILCNGDSATITVTASGGTPPYAGPGTYRRAAGSYTFTVTDTNGCTTSTTILVVEPPTLVAAASAPPIDCNGGTTTVTVSASGGTSPYNGTGTFQRGAGTHVFIVTDANGCRDTTEITIVDPPLLSAAAAATPIDCNGGSSTVTVTGSGGTPPYFGTGTFSRGAGTWTFYVTDSHGCAASATVTITEPPVLTASASAPPVTCGNDSSTVTVTASGGTAPYTGVGQFKRLPGTYTFVVTDSNGCTASAVVTVHGPPPLVASASHTDILCNGGSSTVTITATGGTGPITGTGTFTQSAGTTTYYVSDSLGCVDSVSVTITEPPALNVSCSITNCDYVSNTRVIRVAVSGGTPPYSYLWTPGNYTTDVRVVSCSFSGTVTVRVRDANWNANDPNNSSCEGYCTLTILVKESGEVEIVNETPQDYILHENYPNPFNPSTTIGYSVPEASDVRISVINTLGRVVATLVDDRIQPGSHSVVWDGRTDDGTMVPTGSYIYRMQATSADKQRRFLRDHMMLLLK